MLLSQGFCFPVADAPGAVHWRPNEQRSFDAARQQPGPPPVEQPRHVVGPRHGSPPWTRPRAAAAFVGYPRVGRGPRTSGRISGRTRETDRPPALHSGRPAAPTRPVRWHDGSFTSGRDILGGSAQQGVSSRDGVMSATVHVPLEDVARPQPEDHDHAREHAAVGRRPGPDSGRHVPLANPAAAGGGAATRTPPPHVPTVETRARTPCGGFSDFSQRSPRPATEPRVGRR